MNKALITILVVLICLPLFSQVEKGDSGYLWPTDASRYLTSCFGEYRPQRYHMGLDIKTWGKVGYRVFAIRSGYVLRISVSPYGYGRALYLKLDTGETAVFAHLSGFSEKIERYVKAEQNRRGRYSINLYLKRGQVPVVQGEVVAYTGQTGIGAPHLHFEIRDSANRPINPLSKGYQIPDNVSPIVRALSVRPLDAESEVNGDFKPVVLRPRWVRPGEYEVGETVTIWGNVGLAVSTYDKSLDSFNRYGVYSLKLFVDGVLRFRYQYDKLDFQENKMVELERDYQLARRNFGRFHKLYKDKNNVKSIYWPNRTWAGVLQSASLRAAPALMSKSRYDEKQNIDFQTGELFPGRHEFRVEVADYLGNVSQIYGQLQVGSAFDIQPVIAEDERALKLQNVLTYDLRQVKELQASLLRWNKWQPVPLNWPDAAVYLEKGGDTESVDSPDPVELFLFKKPFVSPLVMKFEAQDEFGVDSYPYFYIFADSIQTSVAPVLTFDYDFYDEYLRLEIESNNILGGIPEITLYPGRRESMPVVLHQTGLKKFIGRIGLERLIGTEHILKIVSQNPNGQEFVSFERFEAERVNPSTSDHIVSRDQDFEVSFWRGSLYRPLYLNISVDSTDATNNLETVGKIYRVTPQDVLMDQGAYVHLRYPASETAPEKLGVYYKSSGNRWTFIDNNLDTKRRTVSAKVLSFEDFTLGRDDEPPEVTGIRPGYSLHLTTSTPLISANVHDRLSGMSHSDNALVLYLDGRKLIAEYDPERNRIFYKCDTPLAKGRHEITVTARDNSHNITTKTSPFWID